MNSMPSSSVVRVQVISIPVHRYYSNPSLTIFNHHMLKLRTSYSVLTLYLLEIILSIPLTAASIPVYP